MSSDSQVTKVTGTVKEVKDLEQISATFSKRSIIIVTDDQYPQTLEVQFTKNNIVRIDPIKVGMKLTIFVNIQGREWTSPDGSAKFFISLNGWKIDILEGQQVAPQQPAPQQPVQQQGAIPSPVPQQPVQQPMQQQPVQQQPVQQHPVGQQPVGQPGIQGTILDDDLPF